MLRALTRRHSLLVSALAALATLATLSAGCANPNRIVRQAVPNPFVGARVFVIQRPSFEGLLVGSNPNYEPEAEYLAHRREHAQDAWEQDKIAMGERLVGSFLAHARGLDFGASAGAPPAEGFVVWPRITTISPGSTFSATIVHMTFTIATPAGQVLDEVERSATVTSSALTGPDTARERESVSIGGRLRQAGDDLGDSIAGYIRRRVENR